MPRRPPLTALLPLLAGAVLLAAGLAMVVAGLAAYQAEAFLRDWQARGSEPSPAAWQVADAAARRAVRWYPGTSGEALDRLGRVCSARYFLHPLGQSGAADGTPVAASRRAAVAAYRAAIAARPDAPAPYAHLAHAKLYLLEFDAEFAHALAEADRLGAFQVEVNQELAAIGFIAWPALDAGQRRRVLAHAGRALAAGGWPARQVLELAQDAGMQATLCASLAAAHPARARACMPPRR